MNKSEATAVLNALVENSQESIFVTDGKGVIILMNEVAANLLNTTIDICVGKSVQELVDKGVWRNSAVLEALKNRRKSSVIISPKGNEKIVSVTTPIFDEKGNIVLTITNSNNETTMKTLIDTIVQEREKAKQYKEEMIYLKNNMNFDLIAESNQMKNILKQINIVANTDTTVALYGESGAGKDVIANLIHRHSNRSDRPLISVNCAAIPENLIESELFGYEKGSFTGANAKEKKGLFEVANNGTIFLDEIGEIPLSFQTKLLRALETNEIRRVGGTEEIKLDVRIICATNKNLEKLVEDGEFRDDLYYRFNVFPVTIPPLRERKADVIPLTEYFLEKLNLKYSTSKKISPKFREQLLKYHWPGNIRELRNIVERAYVISPKDLELDIFSPGLNNDNNREKASDNEIVLPELKEYMHKREIEYIKSVLEKTGGNVIKAAEILNVHRSVIYRKLKEQ